MRSVAYRIPSLLARAATKPRAASPLTAPLHLTCLAPTWSLSRKLRDCHSTAALKWSPIIVPFPSIRYISSTPSLRQFSEPVSEGILVDQLTPDQQTHMTNLETTYRKLVFQHGHVHSQSIEALTQIGDAHWDHNDLELAQTTFEQVLHNLWELHGGMQIDHARIASILHKIGSVHARKGALDEAMKWYHKALRMKEKVYKPNQMSGSSGAGGDGEEPYESEVGLTLNGIAMVHAERGEAQLACVKFQQAASATRHGTTLGDDHPHVGSICENLGLLYMQVRDYRSALPQLEEALRIVYLRPSSEHGESAVVGLLMKIGECHHELNDNNRAKEINEEALRIVVNVMNEPHGPMAAVLRHNMGLVFAKLGLLDDALDSLEQSWELKKRLAGEEHPECASTLNAMGAVYGTKQQLQKALSFFREALRIYQVAEPFDEEGNEHPNVISTKRNIALVEGATLR